MNQVAHIPQTSPMVQFFKAAADPLRLDILRVLRVESFGVMELCHIFSMTQPAMSHHLKILSTAGLVATRREGNSIFYRRGLIPTEPTLANLTRAAFAAIDNADISAAVLAKVSDIHQEREQHSKAFFTRHFDQFKQNQDLIAEYRHYSGCLQDLLQNEAMAANTTVAEIGPGASPLLGELAERFQQVIALDRSEKMLAQAKALHGSHTHIDFQLGEPKDLADESCDLVAINMVLHHMASPSNFFRTIASKITPGGRLFVIDLGPHSQDWTRDVCGDQWLGFDSEDLDNWAKEANFEIGQSAYLGLKNGFQVQLKLYSKT